MGKEANVRTLIAACKKSLETNENRTRKIKGVTVTVSDIETAMLYAETIIRDGSYNGSLMPPRCEVRELLGKFNLLEADC